MNALFALHANQMVMMLAAFYSFETLFPIAEIDGLNQIQLQ